MRIEFVRRDSEAKWLRFASPLLAVLLALVLSGVFFQSLGVDALRALYVFFIEPFEADWSREDLLIKATPLILIGAGLTVCFLSSTWNIGAEGQFVAGALAGSIMPLMFHNVEGVWVLPLMLILGAVGGALCAMVPAQLKVRFGASEILVSLMMVYIMQLLLDYMVRGPWRDPQSFGFPKSRDFNVSAELSPLPGFFDLHWGFPIAIFAAICVTFFLSRTMGGFDVRVSGAAPRAARFSGVSRSSIIIFAFAVSGGMAGLAGIVDVAGNAQKLQPVISPGYGFTAIIVAFLGRLNPVGAIFAGLLLALTYIGGEGAQLALGLPVQATQVVQGLLLFCVLALDTFILYRLRWVPKVPSARPENAEVTG
ncbi:MAG: ABC transporter permease [Pseudomonadota bacterium]